MRCLPVGLLLGPVGSRLGPGPPLAAGADLVELLLRQPLDADEQVLRRVRPDQLVELCLDGRSVPVLRGSGPSTAPPLGC